MSDGQDGRDLFKVLKTLLSMLDKRGYDLGAFQGFDHRMFETKFLRGGDFLRDDVHLKSFPARRDSNEKIMVYWALDEKVGVGPVRNCVNALVEQGVTRAIFVIPHALSPFGKSAITASRDSVLVEPFTYDELRFDVLSHEMVPEHVHLTKERKRQFLRKYQLVETQLPRMRTTDPVARYLGLSKGDVVEITRKSETAGEYVTYRIVWNS